MTKYITHNLDEATYLILKGLQYSIKYNASISATFTFDAYYAEPHRKEFYSSSCPVNIHSWLAIRQSLKNELKSQQYIPIEIKNPHKIEYKAEFKYEPFIPKQGELYWFIDDIGTIGQATFGTLPIHSDRAKDGRCFKSKLQAQVYLANKVVL